MIAVAYIWYPNKEIDMGLFETKEKAKAWLITELVNYNYIYHWYDDIEKKYFEERQEIRTCLEKYNTLEELIEAIKGYTGELSFIIKEK